MQAFLEPLREWKDYESIEKELPKLKGAIEISGCIDAQKSHLIYGLGARTDCRLIVTFQEQKAKELYEDYRFFDEKVLYFPAKDVLFYQADIRGNKLTCERLQVLQALASYAQTDDAQPVTIFTTFDALMNHMAPPEQFTGSVRRFAVGDTIDPEELKQNLVAMGYEREYQADAPGKFAVRGGIIDIYPQTTEQPYRLELWGDEIDSIRLFDAESQRSIEDGVVDEFVLYPANEWALSDEMMRVGLEKIRTEVAELSETFRSRFQTEEAARVRQIAEELESEIDSQIGIANLDSFLNYFTNRQVSLLDYLDLSRTICFLDEPARIMEQAHAVELEFSESMKQRLEKGYILPGQADALYSSQEVMGRLQLCRCIALSALPLKVPHMEYKQQYQIQARAVSAYNRSFELLIQDLKKYKKNKFKVILLSGSRTRAKRMTQDLEEQGVSCFYTEDDSHAVQPGEVMVRYGKVRRGYEYPLLAFSVITESDIFGTQKKKKRYKRYEGEHIRSFSELHVGDYVVHENHGVGIYQGIEKIEVEGTAKDYIKISYAKNSNLYILATQLDLIQKYAGSDAKKPKINTLGTQEWNKTRARVQGAVKEIAKELVELYATRQQTEGYQFGPDTVWQHEFEEVFPFEETSDQISAIEETKRDMESKKIMDRLICGDVGFGKTEVAIRAAFKAVQEGKQVVYLVPTTILAQQHYNTFAQRMKDFPITVDLLCRFRTSAQQKHTIAELKRGMVDIVIGTHRVLSKDVGFKDLGLLIIDEEQRFGVTHKEKIKQLKKNIDVLTLTATPIPRTLHMSLIGIRDMSVLEEPPMDRLPVQTYVMEYNEELVREAISRELARGGQVYYVYNRVNNIADIAARISELIPEASVAYAHGQMKEVELEQIMYAFINGEIDVLISTTIIETGLDISNVNTMIIQDADRMGLSQLYQLRGRVGRSNRTAYAFFMYKRDKLLKEVAEKRLSAIREFTDLGSGFKIAMRDLEIRGAGNLLGAQQHGHMEAVGYDLYCKMLNEAVKEQKGIAPEVAFETTLSFEVDAFIPPGYIANEFQKLDIYKRIASVENDEQADEMLDELIDRFGEPPKSVQNLLGIARLKARAHKLYLTEIAQKEQTLRFLLYPQAPVEPNAIPEFVDRFEGAVIFVPDRQEPAFLYKMNYNSRQKVKSSLEAVSNVLDAMEALYLKLPLRDHNTEG
ncbi:MAG: transcription-repair coupling factor [bacterium]|nr:transcription-repair coupling factor [bacterium]